MAENVNIFSRRTILKQMDLDGEVLDRLEELEIIIPVRRPGKERVYRLEDLDCLRVYRNLVSEMGVNPAGAEIVLRMRNQLLQMRQRIARMLAEMKAQGMIDEMRDILSGLEKDPW